MKTWKPYFWHIILFIFYPFLYLVLNEYIFKTNLNIAKISNFDLLILIFAIFRLVRLFVYDDITDFVRNFLAKWKNWLMISLSELISCPWCTWIWVTLIVIVLYSFTLYFYNLLFILALAWIVSFIQLIYKLIAKISDSYK